MKTILHWLLVIAIILIATATAGFWAYIGSGASDVETEIENPSLILLPVICLYVSAILLWPTLWKAKRHMALKWPRWALAIVLLVAGLFMPVPSVTMKIQLPQARSG